MRIAAFLILIVSLVAGDLCGHNPKIATITLRDTGAGWIVEMSFAQAGIDVAMERELGTTVFQTIERDTYQDKIVEYIKANFNLTVDGNEIVLEQGGILLGSHQTDVKFVLPDVPLQPQSAEVYIPMFEDTYNHTNIFRIYRGGGNLTKFFLSEDNDFSVNIKFDPHGLATAVKQKDQIPQRKIIFSTLFGLLVLCIIIINLRKKGFNLNRLPQGA